MAFPKNESKFEAVPPYYLKDKKRGPKDFPSFAYLFTPPSHILGYFNKGLVNKTIDYIKGSEGKTKRLTSMQRVNLGGGDYEVQLTPSKEGRFIARLTKVEKGDPKLFDNLILTIGPALDLSKIEIQKGFFPSFTNRLEEPVALRKTAVDYVQGTIFDQRYYQGPQAIDKNNPLWVSLCLDEEIDLKTHKFTNRSLNRIIWSQSNSTEGFRQYWEIKGDKHAVTITSLKNLTSEYIYGDSFNTFGRIVNFEYDVSNGIIYNPSLLEKRKLSTLQKIGLPIETLENPSDFISAVRDMINAPFAKLS